ncbi:MAG: family 78 glycoside hydrolase catalytic domain [Alistipes sp.]|nr:family 78 glycoside hydrolase catalytic domain [Candidatus Alistipes equi]
MKRSVLLLSLFLPVLLMAQVRVTDLRVNSLSQADGINGKSVSFSWILNSQTRNCTQRSYEIVILKQKKVVWKSGRVDSNQTVGVKCPVELEDDSRYDWKVRVRDNRSVWSEWASASFLTSLGDSPWKAQWIGTSQIERPVYFTNNLTVKKRVKRATAYITSHGIYEASIAGRRIGEYYLTPGWTSYNKRLQYQTYDVTEYLSAGNIPVEVLVSPGWYSGGINYGKVSKRYRYGKDIMLLMQINVVYQDGSTEVFGTDMNWKLYHGEVEFANIYDGETISHLAKREPVKLLVPNLYQPLIETWNEPIRKNAPLKPVKFITTPKNEFVVDLGQNMVGWEKVQIRGEKGDTIRVYHAEVLDKHGNFYTGNLRTAKATSTFVLSGEGVELFEPSHTFYGFRYLKFVGLKSKDNLVSLEGIPVCSGFDMQGEFSCSNDTINRLQKNIEWGMRGNFLDVPTDCPQRDERLGWTGDAQIFFRTASFLGRVDTFFRKWLEDLTVDQRASGAVPRVIPDTFAKNEDGSEDTKRLGATGWADCATIIPWNHYMAYGDSSILERQWPSMVKWVDFMVNMTKDNGYVYNMKEDHYGDWLFWSKTHDHDGRSAVTSKHLCAQCFFINSINILRNTARILNKKDAYDYYSDLSKKVTEAYLNEYVTPNGLISGDTQTAYVLALNFGLLPDALQKTAVERLVKNIRSYKNHITTGFLGTSYICNVLTDYGRSDVAYDLLLQKTCPSWIYPISMGATTIWERWDSMLKDGSLHKNGMNSFNHYSYGAIGDWLYRSAVGIREIEPGYKRLSIRPHAGGNFKWMQASSVTPYGKVLARWEAQGNVIRRMKVEIPCNTIAEVYVPSSSLDAVRVDMEGLKPLDFKDGYTHYSLGSGTYEFIVGQ